MANSLSAGTCGKGISLYMAFALRASNLIEDAQNDVPPAIFPSWVSTYENAP